MQKSIEGLSYWSETYDAIAWPLDEEGPMRIVAAFDTRANAIAFARSDYGKREGVVYVRPPKRVLRDALGIVQYLLAIADGQAQDIAPLQTH